MKSARLAAFELIYDILNNSAYSNLSLDSLLNEVEEKEKGFVSVLTRGVIERKLTLDYIIGSFLGTKCKPKVKILLYIGAYQLYYMDKVPSNAAINETVELAKKVGCSYYTGLINAVLRKIDTNRIIIDEIDSLSVCYSCPQELINMWDKHYGTETTAKILKSINENAPAFAIPNLLYVDSQELCYELLCDGVECEEYEGTVIIKSSGDITKTRAFKNGLFHIEDLSSYKCVKALDVKSGQVVIDVCSAPGGKAFTAAEFMKNEGCILALDLHQHRVNLIKKGAERLNLSIITADVNNAEQYNTELPKADRVLCDVPCSGFGIIRRKPEIRYKSLDSIKELPDIQYRILNTSSKYVKKGGKLVYSTCTLNKKENEKVVERFLKDNTFFELSEMQTIIPEINGGDGFFFAVLVQKND